MPRSCACLTPGGSSSSSSPYRLHPGCPRGTAHWSLTQEGGGNRKLLLQVVWDEESQACEPHSRGQTVFPHHLCYITAATMRAPRGGCGPFMLGTLPDCSLSLAVRLLGRF